MIATTQTKRATLVVMLRRGVTILAGTYLAIAGVLGAEVLLKNNEATATEHQAALVSQNIKTTNGEIARSRHIVDSDAPGDSRAVTQFSGALSKSASAHNCSVVDFHASSEVAPYLTRFAKTTSVTGWAQVETQFNVSGAARDVVATLTDLQQQQIPYEFDSLELITDQVNSVGDATVIGHATLRVLLRADKGGA